MKMEELQLEGTPELVTERLILRRFCAADAEDMFRNWASRGAVTRYLTWTPHASAQDTRALLEMWEKEYDDPKTLRWCMEFKQTGEAIGGIDVVAWNKQAGIPSIGYCMCDDLWGRGLMTEAYRAVLRYLFAEVGVHKVEACHAQMNPASGRVMQKCGMSCEGVRREHWQFADGSYDDIVLYGLLRAQWDALQD